MLHTITPEWPTPHHVKSLFTTRQGGVSKAPYATLNLGLHVNDRHEDVLKNRALLRHLLPAEPQWLRQIHGTDFVWIEPNAQQQTSTGDAALSHQHHAVCAIMVADCLPVLLCDHAGTVVGVVHAGWRGLAAGVIEQTIAAMQTDPSTLMAWLGPAIGPDYFEVGEDVRNAFITHDPKSSHAFKVTAKATRQTEQKWLADIFLLARQRLNQTGITQIYGGGICTYNDPERFFSYRRDGETGRMAAVIWMEKPNIT